MTAAKSKLPGGPFKMGHAKVGGRKPGTPNRATAEVRTLAQRHGAEAIRELARLAKSATSEQARVAAIKEILDRAYGKSPQPLTGDDDGSPVAMTVQWLPPQG